MVRVRHDSSTGNRLMVPSEHELKTILYEQVSDEDPMTYGDVDYIGLVLPKAPACK